MSFTMHYIIGFPPISKPWLDMLFNLLHGLENGYEIFSSSQYPEEKEYKKKYSFEKPQKYTRKASKTEICLS